MTAEQEKLVLDNLNLVYAVIHRHYPRFARDDDIIQSGNLGLCKAALKWNSEVGVFSTYAYSCILNSIRGEFRQRNKHKDVISLNYDYGDDDGDPNPLMDMMVGDEDVAFVDWDNINKQLSTIEKGVLELKRMGKSNNEVQDILGISHQTFYQSLRKIKRIVKENII